MFGDIAVVPITAMIVAAGFFFLIASIAGLFAEPFLKDTQS